MIGKVLGHGTHALKHCPARIRSRPTEAKACGAQVAAESLGFFTWAKGKGCQVP